MKIIKSINTCQQEIINDILLLHNNSEPLEVDLTYSKGVFYKNKIVKEPKYKLDKYPQTDDTIEQDSSCTFFDNESIKSVIFDPPFLIGGRTYKENKKGSSIILKRFSIYFTFEDLKSHYDETIKEIERILKKDGIAIIKCQNTISSGKQFLSHNLVISLAIKHGLYVKDEFVLISKSKITSFGGRWKTQRHAMKYHSYFIVLKKCKNNNQIY